MQEKVISSLKRGASLVYQEGLLRKGVGLCHGVAGSVYALLAVSDVLDREGPSNATQTYLVQATHLAHLATQVETLTMEGKMNTPDHPWSLYEGLAGMCCAWGAVATRLETERTRSVFGALGMPGYADLILG